MIMIMIGGQEEKESKIPRMLPLWMHRRRRSDSSEIGECKGMQIGTHGDSVEESGRHPVDANPIVLGASDAALARKQGHGWKGKRTS